MDCSTCDLRHAVACVFVNLACVPHPLPDAMPGIHASKTVYILLTAPKDYCDNVNSGIWRHSSFPLLYLFVSLFPLPLVQGSKLDACLLNLLAFPFPWFFLSLGTKKRIPVWLFYAVEQNSQRFTICEFLSCFATPHPLYGLIFLKF